MQIEYRFRLVVNNGDTTHTKNVLNRMSEDGEARERFTSVLKAIQAVGFDHDGFQPPLPNDGEPLVVMLHGYAIDNDGNECLQYFMQGRIGFTKPNSIPKVRVLVNEDGYTSITTSVEMDVVFLDNNCLPEDRPKKKAAKAFYDEFNSLPHQYLP